MLLIIFLSVIVLFLAFIAISFFVMMKNYKITADNQNFRIRNIGNRLSVFLNDKLVITDLSPNLIRGTEYKVNENNNEYLVKCKTNIFGSKMRVEIFKDGQIIADNGKVLKESKKADK